MVCKALANLNITLFTCINHHQGINCSLCLHLTFSDTDPSPVDVLVLFTELFELYPHMGPALITLLSIVPQLLLEDELEVAGLGPGHIVRDVLGVVHAPGEQLAHVAYEGVQLGRQRGPEVVVEEHQVYQTVVDNQGPS